MGFTCSFGEKNLYDIKYRFIKGAYVASITFCREIATSVLYRENEPIKKPTGPSDVQIGVAICENPLVWKWRRANAYERLDWKRSGKQIPPDGLKVGYCAGNCLGRSEMVCDGERCYCSQIDTLNCTDQSECPKCPEGWQEVASIEGCCPPGSLYDPDLEKCDDGVSTTEQMESPYPYLDCCYGACDFPHNCECSGDQTCFSCQIGMTFYGTIAEQGNAWAEAYASENQMLFIGTYPCANNDQAQAAMQAMIIAAKEALPQCGDGPAYPNICMTTNDEGVPDDPGNPQSGFSGNWGYGITNTNEARCCDGRCESGPCP